VEHHNDCENTAVNKTASLQWSQTVEQTRNLHSDYSGWLEFDTCNICELETERNEAKQNNFELEYGDHLSEASGQTECSRRENEHRHGALFKNSNKSFTAQILSNMRGHHLHLLDVRRVRADGLVVLNRA
jgi:hypothetical protein